METNELLNELKSLRNKFQEEVAYCHEEMIRHEAKEEAYHFIIAEIEDLIGLSAMEERGGKEIE